MDQINDISITVDQVKQALDTPRHCIILDVRTPQEYSRGHIQGSINLPVEKVQENIASIVSDKSDVLYVYCLSGSRSSSVVRMLRNDGYVNAFDVSHGLLAWRIKGYSLVT